MIRSLTIQINTTSGPQGELEVVFSRWDRMSAQHERAEFQYAVRVPGFGDDAEGTMAYGHDLRLGAGDGCDHVKAMVVMIDFLLADAEKYGAQLRYSTNTSAEAVMHRTGDSYLFNEKTAEWAYELDGELALARDELAAREYEGPAIEKSNLAFFTDDAPLALEEEGHRAEAELLRRLRLEAVLDAIQGQLDGVSWNADTVERIAAIIGTTGRKIGDVSEDGHAPGCYHADCDEDDAAVHACDVTCDCAPRDWDDSGETHSVTAIGNYQGWALRMYGDNARGAEPDARYDAHVPGQVALSPGFDTLADLLAWIATNEAAVLDEPRPAAPCACESGTRERALYGNVHTDEEGR